MSTLIDFEDLKNRVKTASRNSFQNLQRKYGHQVITGYALCTDDGAMTIFHVANTQSWEENVYEFSPVEWRIHDGVKLFEPTYELISERLNKEAQQEFDEFSESITLTFNAFVMALSELKSEGVFSEHVFLSVLSTDPCEAMKNLERESIHLLNSQAIIQKWESWQAQFN